MNEQFINMKINQEEEEFENEKRITELHSEIEAVNEDIDTLESGNMIPECPDETVESLKKDRKVLYVELSELEGEEVNFGKDEIRKEAIQKHLKHCQAKGIDFSVGDTRIILPVRK